MSKTRLVTWRRGLVGAFVMFVVAQFDRCDRSNPTIVPEESILASATTPGAP